MAIEIEKKYRLTTDLFFEITESLNAVGAEYCGEDLEENILFSNAELFERNAVIRIRKTASRSILTYKQRQAGTSDAKQQLEYESEVADVDTVQTILQCIGLRPILVYEKKRKTYRLRNTEIVLDELPFGLFMEIEGSHTGIAEAEMLLGVQGLTVENETYPRLTAKLGVRNGEIVEARFVSPS